MLEEKIQSNQENDRTQAQISESQLNLLMSKYQNEQNLQAGILAGIAAALIGGVLWAGITAATKYQIGWMAVGVGFLVGFALRYFGKGVNQIFGIIGAVLSLLGCVIGNFLTVVIMVAFGENVSIFSLLAKINFEIIISVLTETFGFMDLIFYGIAVYEGYRFSFRRISEEDLQQLS